jgi:hypothetical protein
VSFISPAAHHKFISLCQVITSKFSNKEMMDKRIENFYADLAELEQLMETYEQTLSKIPDIARQYKELQRRLRVQARRMQPTGKS